MTRRVRLGIAAAAVLAAGVAGMAVSPDVTPAVLAVFAALAAWYVRPHPEQLALIAGSAGAVSLTATAIIRSSGRHLAPGSSASSWQFVEIAALLLLITVVVRAAPPIPAGIGAGLGGAAVSVWIFRFGPPGLSLSFVAGWALWTLVPVVAAGAGGYLRLRYFSPNRSANADN